MRALAFLLLVLPGCAQILGFEEPSEAEFRDSGVPPNTMTDGGQVVPPGDGGPIGPPGACADPPHFGGSVSYGVGTAPIDLDVGDLNQDAIPDVVVADQQQARLIVYHGGQNGIPGQLGTSVDVPVTVVPPCMMGAYSVAIGDFDGDNIADLAYASGFGCQPRVVIRRQSSMTPGTFLAEQVVTTISGPVGPDISLTAGKLNADGRDDLVVLSGMSLQVFLARTDMAGVFTAGFSETSSQMAKFTSPQIADLNGDGLPDLAFPGPTTIRYALQIAGQPGQFAPSSVLGATNPHAFATGRIDGDALDDALVVGNTNQIFLQNPSSHSLGIAGTLMAPLTDQVQIVDLNHDGRNDIASGQQAVLACKAPAPPGTFPTEAASTMIPLNNANQVVYKDLNGDGRADALGLNMPSGLLVVALQQ
jgi:hypothetical protein